jgi:hypothetical protein
LHFLGVVGDCGLVLGDGFSSPTPSALLSVVHAKEIAQAKIAEAIEVAAQQDRQQAQEKALTTVPDEPTSVVGASIPRPQPVCKAKEVGNPKDILVASLQRGKKKKAPGVVLPSRTNLRVTPARQA